MSVATLLNYTYTDYVNWEGKWELIDGTPISMTPAPMRIHQNIVTEILSPSTAKKDETVKFDIYEEEGVQYYILVYPDDLKAKAYSLKDGKYVKVADFTHETLVFDDIHCDVGLDFANVFKKFRK